MAVADGHGGSRYWLSDVGSRLACELAIQLASQDLAQQHLGGGSPDQLQVVQRWLAEKLPGRIVAAWQEAIQADWQGRELPPPHQDEPFSSQSYGSTLALVVLTPHWWGHTGLGDWDLVLLSNHQPDRILSQEAGQGLQGEATESLCLASASRCFAARTAVYSLTEEQRQACGLVLTTDGVRKSCAADDDHLALSRFLLEEAQPGQTRTAGSTERLDSSLDRISRDGSGDDVSVALACFGTLASLPAPAPAERATPAGAAPEPAELLDRPPPKGLEEWPPKPTSGRSRRRQQPTAAPTGPNQLWPRLAVGLGLIAIAGLGTAAWLRLKTPTARQAPMQTQRPANPSITLTDIQAKSINLEIKELCRQNISLINSILTKRKEIARDSDRDQQMLYRLLANSDWNGSMILLYRPGSIPSTQLSSLCPSLRTALNSYWSQQTLDAPTKTPIQQPAQSSE
jgi:hypothetical protein